MPPKEKRLPRDRPPIEVMDGAAPARLRAVAGAIASATAISLLLGSNALLAWATALPVGPTGDFALDLAQRWQEAMDSLGLTAFASAITALLHAFQGAVWPGT